MIRFELQRLRVGSGGVDIVPCDAEQIAEHAVWLGIVGTQSEAAATGVDRFFGPAHFSQYNGKVQPSLMVIGLDCDALLNEIDGLAVGVALEGDQTEVMQARRMARQFCQHAAMGNL